MTKAMILQGREVSAAIIELIRSLIAAHPMRGRTPLSQDLCRRWNWRLSACGTHRQAGNAQGQIKDMAARTLLLKLERAGHIKLPPCQRNSPNALKNRRVPEAPVVSEPIRAALRDLRPLRVTIAAPGSEDAQVFNGLLAHEHYLGHRNTVGENLRYLVQDCRGRTVACVLFGSVKDVYLYPLIADFQAQLSVVSSTGHPKHERPLFPEAEITEFHDYRLDACPECNNPESLNKRCVSWLSITVSRRARGVKRDGNPTNVSGPWSVHALCKDDPLLSSSSPLFAHIFVESPSFLCYPPQASSPGTHADRVPG